MPNTEPKPNCPQCEQNDQVVKVSHLYLLARERKQPSQPFAPPSGKKQTMRPIHPDMVAGALTLAAVVFFVNVFKTQPSMLLPMALVLAAFYAFYFLMRKKILARYQADLNQENAYKGNIEAAVGEWMKLHFCARDKGVFNPDDPEAGLIPLEQMRAYLMRKK